MPYFMQQTKPTSMVFIAVNPETRRHLACTVNELTATQDTTDRGRERMQAPTHTHARPATAGLLSGQLSPLLQFREEGWKERGLYHTFVHFDTVERHYRRQCL